MTTTARIRKHETAIEILQGIKGMKSRIRCTEENIKSWAADFWNLTRRWQHDLEIRKAAIVRLELRYQRVMKELTER